ncbi:MAG: GNAT family protein [archaeon]
MKIETRRLILRPPKIGGWRDIVEGVRDINVSKMLAVVPRPYVKKDALWFINHSKNKDKKKKKESYTFCIELKSEKKVIGITSIEKIDYFNRKTKTGSWINRKYWRKGYLLEAKVFVLDFIFKKLKLKKVETGAFVENKASQNMSRKIGFKKEGLRKKTILCKATGKFHDEVLFGLLKEDWNKVRPRLIKYLNKKSK